MHLYCLSLSTSTCDSWERVLGTLSALLSLFDLCPLRRPDIQSSGFCEAEKSSLLIITVYDQAVQQLSVVSWLFRQLILFGVCDLLENVEIVENGIGVSSLNKTTINLWCRIGIGFKVISGCLMSFQWLQISKNLVLSSWVISLCLLDLRKPHPRIQE